MASPTHRSKMGLLQPKRDRARTTAVAIEIQKLIVQFARENPAWGYDRIAGALANLGHMVADQTIGNILKQYSLGPADDRKRGLTWAEFIRRHKDVLCATD